MVASRDNLSLIEVMTMTTQATEDVPDRYKGLNRGGRKPGATNRSTQTFRETITNLLQDNSSNVGIWLERVSQDDPAKALDLLAKLAEYAAPKLSKVEQTSEVTVTHGYAFAIERPVRPALEGEILREENALEQLPNAAMGQGNVVALCKVDQENDL